MAILESYSRRKRQRQNSGKADVYRHDDVPRNVRMQIIDLWRWATGPVTFISPFGVGRDRNDRSWNLWAQIVDALRHEKGLPSLSKGDDPFIQCGTYFLNVSEIDDLLDVLEFTFQCIANLGELNEYQQQKQGISMDPATAIRELNFRLQEAGVASSSRAVRSLR